jgi:hypothetical protein
MQELSAPLFDFGGNHPLPATDVHLRDNAPQGQLAMTGPCTGIDGASLPVRGDLAHIKLAGRYFVPHYAVPVAFTAATGGAALRSAASSDADVLATLDAGTAFNVLDIAGSWAWGQVGEDGLVGYVALPDLNASGQ